ncbi:MAG: hypothetical protein ACPGJV_08675 [Bacteriovoracaceae bacterium]
MAKTLTLKMSKYIILTVLINTLFVQKGYSNYKFSFGLRQSYYLISFTDSENSTKTSLPGQSSSGFEFSNLYMASSGIVVGLKGYSEVVRFNNPITGSLDNSEVELNGINAIISFYKYWLRPELRIGKDSRIYINNDELSIAKIKSVNRTNLGLFFTPSITGKKKSGLTAKLDLGYRYFFLATDEGKSLPSTGEMELGAELNYYFSSSSIDFRIKNSSYTQKVDDIDQENKSLQLYLGVSFGN